MRLRSSWDLLCAVQCGCGSLICCDKRWYVWFFYINVVLFLPLSLSLSLLFSLLSLSPSFYPFLSFFLSFSLSLSLSLLFSFLSLSPSFSPFLSFPLSLFLSHSLYLTLSIPLPHLLIQYPSSALYRQLVSFEVLFTIRETGNCWE